MSQFTQGCRYGSSPYNFPILITHSYLTQQRVLVVKHVSYLQNIIDEFRVAKLLPNLSKSLKDQIFNKVWCFICLKFTFWFGVQVRQQQLWLLCQDQLLHMWTILLPPNEVNLLCPIQVWALSIWMMSMIFVRRILQRVENCYQRWEGCHFKRKLRRLHENCKQISSISNFVS